MDLIFVSFRMNFIVEATIGAGKTTLIKNMIQVLLKDHDIDAQAVLEPVIMSTMSAQRTNSDESEVTLFERSLDSAKLVFQRTLAEEGSISPLQNHILDKLFLALKPGSPTSDGIIYIKVSDRQC